MPEPMDLSPAGIDKQARKLWEWGQLQNDTQLRRITAALLAIRDAATAAERERCIAIVTTYMTGDAQRTVKAALAALRGGA